MGVMTPTLLEYRLTKAFIQGMKAVVKPDWMKIAEKQDSGGLRTDDLGYFATGGGWDEEDKIGMPGKDMSAFVYRVTTKEWRREIRVKRKDLRDDKFGKYEQIANLNGRKFQELLNYQLFYLLQNGTSGTGYDSAAFFSASHNGSQDNRLAAGDYGQSVAEIQAGFRKAKAMLKKFYDEDGDSSQNFYNTDISDLVIICNPDYEDLFIETFQAKTVSTGGQNVYVGGVKDIVSHPVITNTGANAYDWYLLRMNSLERPCIWREHAKPTTRVFEEKYHISWVGESSGVARYGNWKDAVKIINS